MRLAIYIVIIILTTRSASGQDAFNRIYHIPAKPLTFLTINVRDSEYVVSGTFIDTVGQDYTGMVLHRLNSNGDVETIELYGSYLQNYVGIGHSNSYLEEIYLHHCTAFLGDTLVTRIIWIDSDLDTIRVSEYMSPHYGLPYPYSQNIATNYSVLAPDSTVYLANVVVGETTFNDAALQKLDKDGNILWIYDHATMSDPDKIFGVVPTYDGVIYAAIESSTQTTATNHALVKLNNDGVWQWEINTNDFQPNVGRTGTLVMDSEFLIACGAYRDPSMEDYYPVACVYKVDTLGNLAWMNSFGEYNDYVTQEFSDVVQTTDGNYVAAGTWKTIPGTEEIPEGYTAVDYDEFAYVVKFDREDGSIIWDRKYRWLEVYRDNHTLRDMKATPDGGVIFCGEVQDLYMQQFEDFSQRGWVVKLDECGCLVPGCDTSCTDIAVREQSGVLPLLLSPNPASDILNVHVGGYSLSKDAALQIIDLSGRIVSTHRIPANNTTYMMRVDELPAGNYVVQLMNEGKVLANGKVLVN